MMPGIQMPVFELSIKPQMVRGPLQGKPHGGIGSRNGITIATEVDAELRIDPDGCADPKVIHPSVQGTQGGLFVLETCARSLVGDAMHAHIGNGVQPEPGGRVDSGQPGEVQAIEETFFDVPHIVFDASLFMGGPHVARSQFHPEKAGKVQIARVINCRALNGCWFNHPRIAPL